MHHRVNMLLGKHFCEPCNALYWARRILRHVFEARHEQFLTFGMRCPANLSSPGQVVAVLVGLLASLCAGKLLAFVSAAACKVSHDHLQHLRRISLAYFLLAGFRRFICPSFCHVPDIRHACSRRSYICRLHPSALLPIMHNLIRANTCTSVWRRAGKLISACPPRCI